MASVSSARAISDTGDSDPLNFIISCIEGIRTPSIFLIS